jgi:hypothetical protein
VTLIRWSDASFCSQSHICRIWGESIRFSFLVIVILVIASEKELSFFGFP